MATAYVKARVLKLLPGATSELLTPAVDAVISQFESFVDESSTTRLLVAIGVI